MAAILPPSTIYNSAKERSMVGAFNIGEYIDWDTATDNIQYFPGDEIVIDQLSMRPNSCAIFDVKQYNLKTGKIANYGFAVYPLIKIWQSRMYMVSGVVQLPIY